MLLEVATIVATCETEGSCENTDKGGREEAKGLAVSSYTGWPREQGADQ